MQIGDAGFVKRRGKLALGKARPPRGRHRAGIDQQLDPGALEFPDHRGGQGFLVADGEERSHAVTLVADSKRKRARG